jgi:predicted DNA-binding transcriptional regulator AlpA
MKTNSRDTRKKQRDKFKLQVAELRKSTQSDKLLTLVEVVALTGYSVPTIYRLQQRGAFPHSIRCEGGRAVRWVQSEILAWIAHRTVKQNEIFYASQGTNNAA